MPHLGDYRHELTLGFDYKQANNNIAFGGARAFGSAIDVLQFMAAYSGRKPDRWGETAFVAELFYAPGNWTQGSSNAAYAQARVNARPEYWYGRFALDRTFRLPAECSLVFRGLAQVADANLPPSEQFGVGGWDTVRGYEERTLNGDYALVWSSEIRGPAWALHDVFASASEASGAGEIPIDQSLQLLGFVDVGWAAPYTPLPGQATSTTLASIGVGFRYQWSAYASVRFDYGWQLLDSRTPLTDQNSRANFGVVLSY